MSAIQTHLLTRTRLVLIVTVALLASAFAVTRQGQGDGDVVGIFADASPLEVGSEVRASGVRVGEVKSITLEDGHARVELKLSGDVLPLHSDARMTVRPINLLGENYVEVEPGSPDSSVLDGVVPIKQTGTIVTLQSLLDTFDDPTSTGLAALVSELGTGVSGQGTNLAGALQALAPTMQGIDKLGDVLREQNTVLNDLVEKAEPVAGAVAGPDNARLDRLVAQARTTLTAVAAEREGLQQTIDQLPSTLAQARRTLAALDHVSTQLTPVLSRARPVTSDLQQISKEIVTFSRYATPAFGSFDKVFAYADQLLAQAGPAVTELRVEGPALQRSAANLKPIGDQLLDQHLGDLMTFVRDWALSTNSRDNVSHYFRGVVHVSPAALNSLLGSPALPEVLTPGGDGSGQGKTPLPDVPGVKLGKLQQSVQNLLNGGLVGGLAGQLLPNLLGGGTATTDRQSATGLTQGQEHNLLTQLLGGLS